MRGLGGKWLKMLKSIRYFLLVLFAMFIISSCSRNESDAKKMLENFEFIESDSYKKDIFLDASRSLEEPQGIACTESGIYVVDKKRDSIELYSYEGVLIDSIGETGNSEGQLLSPTAIAVDKDNTLYVAEEGNKRITCYDKEYNFLKCYYLNEIVKDKSARILDIEVDNDKTIYCTIASYDKKVCGLYRIKDGKVERHGNSISGMLGTNKEFSEIKYVQRYKWDNEGIMSATGYIGSIQENKIIRQGELPKGYSATDILIYNNDIYLFSGGYNTFDKFTMDGQYIETVYSEVPTAANRGMGYVDCDVKGNFYISDSENKEVHKLSLK